MTLYELIRIAAAPVLPAISVRIRRDLDSLVRSLPRRPARILDVGGRRSPYTVGLPAQVTVLEVPREGRVHERLGLGMTDEVEDRLRRMRSNVVHVVLQDMARCTLPDASYDGVVCVEVIEHVVEIAPFLDHVARVLIPGGWAYFTTPNGDYFTGRAPAWNPDHVRHYGREELDGLLAERFAEVDVRYAVRTGRHRVRGQGGIRASHPLRSVGTILANVRNRIESRGLDGEPWRTAHLIAVARKGGPGA